MATFSVSCVRLETQRGQDISSSLKLSDTQEDKHSLQPDWSLKMSNLTLSDNGVYTCEVATPFETITSQIAVRVSGEPPRILSDFKKIVVYEGESLEIRCLVRGVPRPTLTWYVV